ncbi:MAG: signal recognition particle protein, partial [Legionellaceae bacterium]|nr:signal recognition particle protein [Legionellaceae bacterium]
MFENLTKHLTESIKYLGGQRRFTEESIKPVLKEVRLALLEADVALPVVKDFAERIREKAVGQVVEAKLKPEQALIKIVHDELVELMGSERAELNFKTEPPAVFLMAGLQGSGKTTSAAKLAKHLKEVEKKKVMLASVDVYRPAAIEQLALLAKSLEVDFFDTDPKASPIKSAKKALAHAKKQFVDVLILDTAGRLHVDDAMMDEIKSLHKVTTPTETLFVVDSMTGQDAVHTAEAFHEALPLTGIILTKTDGDARGGAALSMRHITGQPIKFMGSGEKVDALEPFHPERVASRIIGMGDILSLIEEVEQKADKKTHDTLTKKLKKGRGFDLNDFKEQLIQMNQMGGISGMMSKLPGMNLPSDTGSAQKAEKSMAQTVA